MSDDRGETLLELVVAVAIMAVAVVAIVGGMSTSIMLSDVHRKQARAGTAARDYAEAAVTWVTAGHYDASAAPKYDTATVGYAAPSGYTAAPVSVTCWDGAAWKTCSGTGTGLEQLTVRVNSSDGRASETVVVVLREPSCQQEGKTCN